MAGNALTPAPAGKVPPVPGIGPLVFGRARPWRRPAPSRPDRPSALEFVSREPPEGRSFRLVLSQRAFLAATCPIMELSDITGCRQARRFCGFLMGKSAVMVYAFASFDQLSQFHGPFSPRPVPAWARDSAESLAEAAFCAGAALASLDGVMRAEHHGPERGYSALLCAPPSPAAAISVVPKTNPPCAICGCCVRPAQIPGRPAECSKPGIASHVRCAYRRRTAGRRFKFWFEQRLHRGQHRAFLDQMKTSHRPLANAAAAASAVKAAEGEGASSSISSRVGR